MAHIGGKTLGDKREIIAALFASGNGSNAENIMRCAKNSDGKISIPLVVCNKTGAGVIERAEKLGVPCEITPVTKDGFESFGAAKQAQEEKILAALKRHGVNWIFLAGYMQVISPFFLSRFAEEQGSAYRIVNIHPSLLPAFPGKDGYGDAFRAGIAQSGVTLHFVDEGVDTGSIIAQKTFERKPDDTLESFRARGMKMEYEVYAEFIKQLAEGEVEWAKR